MEPCARQQPSPGHTVRAARGLGLFAAPLSWVVHDLFADSSLDDASSPAPSHHPHPHEAILAPAVVIGVGALFRHLLLQTGLPIP